MSSKHQTPGACAHAHLSSNDPTSTIQELYSDNSSTSSSSPHVYAAFECSACKAAHSNTQNFTPPAAAGPAPENESPTQDCNSKCSGRTKCDRTDDNITDSDLNADVQAWSDIVQCWEIANLSTSSRYSDRSSIDSHTSFRSEGEPNFLDEEHDTIAV